MVLTLVFGCTSHTKSDMELVMYQLAVQLNGLNLEVWSLPNYIFLFGTVSSLREGLSSYLKPLECCLFAI